jgi:hypothetical protein
MEEIQQTNKTIRNQTQPSPNITIITSAKLVAKNGEAPVENIEGNLQVESNDDGADFFSSSPKNLTRISLAISNIHQQPTETMSSIEAQPTPAIADGDRDNLFLAAQHARQEHSFLQQQPQFLRNNLVEEWEPREDEWVEYEDEKEVIQNGNRNNDAWIPNGGGSTGTHSIGGPSGNASGPSSMMQGLAAFGGVAVIIAGVVGVMYSRKRRRATANRMVAAKMPKMEPIMTNSLLSMRQYDMEVGKGVSPGAFSTGASYRTHASVLIDDDDDDVSSRMSFESRLLSGSIMTENEDYVEEIGESLEPAFSVQVLGRVQSGMSGLSEFSN